MTVEIRLRLATADDAQALATLAALTFPLACPSYHTPENIARHLERVLSPERFAEYATSDDYHLTVADMAGSIIGYGMVDYQEATDPIVREHLGAHARAAELSKLYVHPEFHGVGISHGLLEQALGDMSARGKDTAWLTVNQLNARANAFYEKSGFAIVADKIYRVGDVIDDDYLRVHRLVD